MGLPWQPKIFSIHLANAGKFRTMGVQWQSKIILPVALGLIFLMVLLFENVFKSSPDGVRYVFRGKAAAYGSVNLADEEPALPSISKTAERILHEPESCTNMANFKPTYIFFIFSVAANYDRRKAIRDTWGKLIKAECGLRLIFVLGVIDSNADTRAANEELQIRLDKEAEEHKDVLQFGQIIDGSRTLTRKAQLTFEWFLRECPTADYIAKGEDHTWINPNTLMQFVGENKPESIFGHRVYSGSPVFRDPKSYFYVSRKDMPVDTYPEYMISMMYVIPKGVLQTLLTKAKEVHAIPLEDVYWTGIVADYAKIPRKNTEGYEYDYIFDKKKFKCPKKDLMAVRYMPPTEVYKYEEDQCYKSVQCTSAGATKAAAPTAHP